MSGRPGTRAPHVWLDAELRTSTIDLFAGQFVMLTANERWVNAAVDNHIHVQSVASNHAALSAFGLNENGAVLVRPDGFVGWRTNTDMMPHILRETLDQLMCRIL